MFTENLLLNGSKARFTLSTVSGGLVCDAKKLAHQQGESSFGLNSNILITTISIRKMRNLPRP
jgi:hypothetical protein